MIYARWLALTLLDWLLLLTVPFAAPIIAAIYREQPYGMAPYSWGSIWGTYDNPPQAGKHIQPVRRIRRRLRAVHGR